MKLRKIWSAVMLLVIPSQIFANTPFTASEIVSYVNENETTEVPSDSTSQAQDTEENESTKNSEGTSTATGLVNPTTNYNIKAEDFVVSEVGNLIDGTSYQVSLAITKNEKDTLTIK